MKTKKEVIMELCSQFECSQCPLDAFRKRHDEDCSSAVDRLCNIFGVQTAEDKPAKPTLPKWCEVGRWMMDYCGKILKIVKVEGGLITIYSPEANLVKCVSDVSELSPVRFRPYTYNEVKRLFGKVIEYGSATRKFANLVDSVSSSCDEILVCGERFSTWQERGATIDGIPFGVPEVDEEAEEV